jgi:integrase
MAWLHRRGSIFYIKHSVAGRKRRVSTGAGSLQIAKERLRRFESAQARGETCPLPTRTPIADVVAAYVDHIRTFKTAKSAQTDIYYLQEVFGPVCDGLRITSRKLSAKAKKRPPKPDQDRRRKAAIIEADSFEQITTAQIAMFISAQMQSRGLAPKTANRYREILTRLFNWAMTQHGLKLADDKNPAAKVDRYKEDAPEIRFLTLPQVDQQIAALAKNVQLQSMVITDLSLDIVHCANG